MIVLDGYGLNPSKKNNAVYEANTPRLDEYFGRYAHTAIQASGEAVGLPVGQFGNSEVGHATLGCGSIVRQDLMRIDDAIGDGSFFNNSVLLDAMREAKLGDRPVHLVGLVSDGGVHSHCRHLAALIRMCRKNKVRPVVHMITDGRDTAPKSAMKHVVDLEKWLVKVGGQIATVIGLYYAMDRDRRWERTRLAWDLMANGVGELAPNAAEGIERAYEKGQTDEFLKPILIENATTIDSEDTLIFFNFRDDRPRQLAEALGMDEFEGFDRGNYVTVTVTCLTEYDPKLLAPIVFPPERPKITLTKAVSFAGYKQLHCPETEKYAHVTYFFNGGREEAYAGEDRRMIHSPPVDTYDHAPEISATEIADASIDAINTAIHAFLLVNFANGDMVGHTARREAIIHSLEHMDKELMGLQIPEAMTGRSLLLKALGPVGAARIIE